ERGWRHSKRRQEHEIAEDRGRRQVVFRHDHVAETPGLRPGAGLLAALLQVEVPLEPGVWLDLLQGDPIGAHHEEIGDMPPWPGSGSLSTCQWDLERLIIKLQDLAVPLAPNHVTELQHRLVLNGAARFAGREAANDIGAAVVYSADRSQIP